MLPAGRSTHAFHNLRPSANDRPSLAYLDIAGEGLAVIDGELPEDIDGPVDIDGVGTPAISDTDLPPMSIGVPGKMMLW